MSQYAKVHQTFYSMLWAFFSQQMELMLTKIDFAVIRALLSLLNQTLLNAESPYEV